MSILDLFKRKPCGLCGETIRGKAAVLKYKVLNPENNIFEILNKKICHCCAEALDAEAKSSKAKTD